MVSRVGLGVGLTKKFGKAFALAKLPGVLWLQGSDLTSGAIASWIDKYGGDDNAVQATSGKRPTATTGYYGQKCADHDGADDNFVHSANLYPVTNGNFSVVVGWDSRNAAVDQALIFGQAASARAGLYYYSAGHIRFYCNTGLTGESQMTVPAIGTRPHITMGIKSGTPGSRVGNLYHDGVKGPNGTCADVTLTNLLSGVYSNGASGWHNGRTYVVMLFPFALSDEQRIEIEGLLATMLGTKDLLPPAHKYYGASVPYNTVQPVVSGLTALGSTLSVTNGTWQGTAPTSYTYQWLSNGQPITGASGSTYTVMPSVMGTTVTCSVSAANGGGSTPAVSSNGIAIDNPLPLSGFSSQNRAFRAVDSRPGKTYQAYRNTHLGGQAASHLVVVHKNWYALSTAAVGTGNVNNVIECYVEYNGVAVLTKYSGISTKTLADNDTYIKSDPIPADAFGVSSIPYAATVRVHGIHNGVLIPFPSTVTADVPEDQSDWFDPAATTISAGNTAGKYTATSGAALESRTNGYRPFLMCHPLDASAPSGICQGDSIQSESDDQQDQNELGRGVVQRATHDAGSSANPIPMMNFARGGSLAVLASGSTQWRPYIKHANFDIDGYLTNDINGSVNNATCESRITAVWDVVLAENPSIKIIRLELMPRTTGSWGSPGTQGYANGWGPGQQSDHMNNTYFPAQLQAGKIHAIAPMSAVRDPSDLFKWAPNLTSDGIHPNSNGANSCEICARSVRGTINYLFYGPQSLSGRYIHFDGAKIGSVLESGGAVYQQNDESGNNFHATQPTPGNQPAYSSSLKFYGRRYVDYDGGDKLDLGSGMFGLSNGAYCRVTAFFLDTLQNTRPVGGNGGGDHCEWYDHGAGQYVFMQGGASVSVTFTATVGGLIVSHTLFDGSNLSGSVNGINSAIVAATPFTMARYSLGVNPPSNDFLPGGLLESLTFNRVLSPAEIAQQLKALRGKWGGL